MRLILITFLLAPLMGLAQEAIKIIPDRVTTCLSHNLILFDRDEVFTEVENEHAPGRNACYTKLYIPEQRRYIQMYLNYIRKKGKVRNYNTWQGPWYPESAGNFKIANFLAKPHAYDVIGGLYVPKEVPDKWSVVASCDKISVAGIKRIEGKKWTSPPDTVWTEDVNTGEYVQEIVEVTENFYDIATRGDFVEQWTFDVEKGALLKDVKYMGLHRAVYTENHDFKGFNPIFLLPAEEFNRTALKDINMLKENMEYDVMRDMDFNQFDYHLEGMARSSNSRNYIEPSERFTLLASIMQSARQGHIRIKRYELDEDFEMRTARSMSIKEYFAGLHNRDVLSVENPKTGLYEDVVVETETKMSDIYGLRFIEDWYIDPTSLSLYKRVKGIALLVPSYSEDGEYKGSEIIGNGILELQTWY